MIYIPPIDLVGLKMFINRVIKIVVTKIILKMTTTFSRFMKTTPVKTFGNA